MHQALQNGWFRVYLKNGNVVTIVPKLSPDAKVVVISRNIGEINYVDDVETSYEEYKKYTKIVEQWRIPDAYPWKFSIGQLNYCWIGRDDFDDTVFTLVLFHYELEDLGIDSQHVNTWYVRLDRPVNEIIGALDDEGRLTDDFVESALLNLWDMGLRSPTPLSAYSPTGLPYHTLHVWAVGRRVIVQNTSGIDC